MSPPPSAREVTRFWWLKNGPGPRYRPDSRSRIASWRHVLAAGVLCAAIVSAPALTIWNLSVRTNAYIGILQCCVVLTMLPEVSREVRSGLDKSLVFRVIVIGFLICTTGWLAQGISVGDIDRTLFYVIQPMFVLAAKAWFYRTDSNSLPRIYYFKLWATVGAIAYLFIMLWLAAVPDLDWRQAKRLPIYRNIRHLDYDLAIVASLGTACWMARPAKRQLLNWGLFVLLGYVSVWSAGRGQILTFICFLVVYAVSMRGQQMRLKLLHPTVAFLLGGSAFCLLNPEMALWILGRSSAGSADEISSGRVTIWIRALETVLAANWQGIVLGLGPDAFIRHEIAPGLVQPHNVIVQIVLEFGLFGLAVVGLLVVNFAKRCRHMVVDANASVLVTGAVSALLALLFYSMFDGIFYHASPFLASMLLIAFILSRDQRTEARARS